jgi:hypothetical protein
MARLLVQTFHYPLIALRIDFQFAGWLKVLGVGEGHAKWSKR